MDNIQQAQQEEERRRREEEAINRYADAMIQRDKLRDYPNAPDMTPWGTDTRTAQQRVNATMDKNAADHEHSKGKHK